MSSEFKGIDITAKAAEKVQAMLEQRGTPEAAVRIGVTTAGCSGLSYKLEYSDNVEQDDHVFERHGIRVIVDGKSLLIIDGTRMDFVHEQFKSGFQFSNPKENERCGCGESFKV